VFPATWGTVLDPTQVRMELAAIAKAAGLPAITPRTLRHAVATALLANGVPMKVVQELLGHRTYRQTADTYAHVSETMQRQAVDAITKAVGE
jgi:site-specific recombinase XerD